MCLSMCLSSCCRCCVYSPVHVVVAVLSIALPASDKKHCCCLCLYVHMCPSACLWSRWPLCIYTRKRLFVLSPSSAVFWLSAIDLHTLLFCAAADAANRLARSSFTIGYKPQAFSNILLRLMATFRWEISFKYLFVFLNLLRGNSSCFPIFCSKNVIVRY